MTDKAVILAAGRGTRMQRPNAHVSLSAVQEELANTGSKALIPVGEPFINYVLSTLSDAGFHQVCLVISPHHNRIRRHCEKLGGGRLQISFAVQSAPLGTAHALLSAEEFSGGQDFVMINSDNYYPLNALVRLRLSEGFAIAAFRAEALARGNIMADRLRQFAIIRNNDNGFLNDIIEKPPPKVPVGDNTLINMNCWRFGPAVFEGCRRVALSTRGEYELPDAVMYTMKELQQPVRVLVVDEPVLDLSCRMDVASVAKHLESLRVRL